MKDQQIVDTSYLDALRGFAAIYVMICHGSWYLWDYNQVLSTTNNAFGYGIIYMLLQMVEYAHFAVILFFVLSGFVIHLKHAARLNENKNYHFEIKKYLVHRVRRIYPPLLFALALTYLLDSYIIKSGFMLDHSLAYKSIYENKLYLDFSTFIGNIFFLTGSYAQTFGSDNPLWSLTYEWWFYLIYPVFFQIVKRVSLSVATVLAFLLYLTSNFIFKLPEANTNLVFSMFFLWWLGALLADLYVRNKLRFRWMLAISIIAPISLLNVKLKLVNYKLNDLFFTIGITSFLGSLLTSFQTRVHALLVKFQSLGAFSYTLYIIHMPIQKFLCAQVVVFFGYTGRPVSIIFFLLSIPLIMLIAYLLHFLVEKPFLRKSQAHLIKL